jgi:hypothetical protein
MTAADWAGALGLFLFLNALMWAGIAIVHVVRREDPCADIDPEVDVIAHPTDLLPDAAFLALFAPDLAEWEADMAESWNDLVRKLALGEGPA